MILAIFTTAGLYSANTNLLTVYNLQDRLQPEVVSSYYVIANVYYVF